MSDSKIQAYLQAVSRHDSNADGYLTSDELFSYLEQIGLFTTPDTLMRYLNTLNLKKSAFNKNDISILLKAILADKEKNTSNRSLEQIKSSATNFFMTITRSAKAPKSTAVTMRSRENILDISKKREEENSEYEYYSYGSDSEYGEPDEQKELSPTDPSAPFLPKVKQQGFSSNQSLNKEKKQNRSGYEQVSSSTSNKGPLDRSRDRPSSGLTRAQTMSRARKPAEEAGRPNLPSGAPGSGPSRKGVPKALMDPRVRKQLSRMKDHRPLFTTIISILQIFTMSYALFINNGFEAPLVNPFIGPTTVTLIQMGAKYVPCMRPNPDLSSTVIVDCNAKYPSTRPRTINGSCYYYDNLAYVCGMGGFSQPTLPDQIWRFFTPTFIHTGFIHLAFNMMIQLRTGVTLERQMGATSMFIVYMTCGAAGVLLSSIISPDTMSAGSSGSLFGLFALLLVDLLLNWPILVSPWKDLSQLLTNMFLGIVIGLLPFVDNFAHIGGFIAGCLCGLIFIPAVTFNTRDKHIKQALRLASIPILLGGLALGFYIFWQQWPVKCPWCTYVDCVPPGQLWCAS